MIDLLQGSLYDLLPVQWKTEEADAISYALQWGTQLLISLAKQTRLRADVDTLPERILDIMAVEMQAPYYGESLPIDAKREIIKRTVKWHMHAGTPSAVTELMEVVFGSGRVIENWEDDFEEPRKPYLFDLETRAVPNRDSRAQVMGMLSRVKNVRSHLRYLIYEHEPIDIDVTVTVESASLHSTVLPELDKNFDFGRGPDITVLGTSLIPTHLPEVDKNFDFAHGPTLSVTGGSLAENRLAEREKRFDFGRGPVVRVSADSISTDVPAERDKNFDFGHGARAHAAGGTIAVQYLRNLND